MGKEFTDGERRHALVGVRDVGRERKTPAEENFACACGFLAVRKEKLSPCEPERPLRFSLRREAQGARLRVGGGGAEQHDERQCERVAQVGLGHILIELRAIVEPQTAALAAERATAGDIADLRARATLPYDPSVERGFVDYCRAHSRFHLGVVRCARNPRLENIVMSALDMYQRPTYLRIGRQLDPRNPSAKHHAIVDAIEQHDPDAARAVMLAHIRGGGERILKALKAAGYH